jgi:RNA 3'-terminal phosphate cyclase-like protein
MLELIQKVTNGTEVNINKTGTRLILKPGIIDSAEGAPIEHKCDLKRSISYYLECIVLLGLFGKQSLNLTLTGNTDDSIDQSIDSLKSSLIYLFNQFGVPNSLDIQVKKRGYAPLGGGVVKVTQMYARKLEPISLTDEGKIKRIRGLVTSAKVSPQLTARVIDKLREIFNDFIPDVWIHADHYKKGFCGDQPGYGISLTAETTTGVILTKDFNFGNEKEFTLPEDLGERAALALLDEIYSGGCIDSSNQSFALLMMSVSSADNICALKLGRITQQSISMLQNIKKFLNVNFKIEECQDDVYDATSSDEEEQKSNQHEGDSEEGEEEQIEKDQDVKIEEEEEGPKPQFGSTFIYSCIGIGLQNFARKIE